MTVNISLLAGAGWQFFDNNGAPLAGGLIYTYAAGTTTPQATYTSNTGVTANPNPIVLNSAGRVPNEIWLTSGVSYKFVLKDSTGVQIGSYDNLSSVNDFTSAFTTLAASSGSSLIGYIEGDSGSVATTVQTKLRESVSVKDFGAVGNGTTDDRAAFIAAIAVGKAVFVPKGTYYLSDKLTLENVILYGEGQGVFFGDAKTILLFAANKSGLYLTGQGTCRVSDLCVASQTTTYGAGVGIRVSAHGSVVENVLIYGFGTHGLQIFTDVGENANNSYIKCVRALSNRGNGFNVGAGADVNACTLTQCDASDNLGIGYYSYAANTLYDHCHAANNGTSDFDEGSGSNIFLIPYSETGTFNVSNTVPTGSIIISVPFGDVTVTGNVAYIAKQTGDANFNGIRQTAPFWINGGAGLYGFTNDATYGFSFYDRTNNRFVKQWNLTQTQERNRALIMSDLGFGVVEGTNARQGVATLVAGTVTVACTAISATSRIFLTSQSDGGTPGFLRVSTRVNGVSFTITSSSGADTSIVAYEIFEPAVASGTAL